MASAQFGLTAKRGWPATAEELEKVQLELAAANRNAGRWTAPDGHELVVAGAFVAYRRGVYGVGAAGDTGWAAAASYKGNRRVTVTRLRGIVGAPYLPGYLALREGPLLEQVVRQLVPTPDVVMFDSTGLDHPRRAGLAVQLGAMLDMPTLGVTDRTLVATFEFPGSKRGDRTPLKIGDEVVGFALRTQDGVKPVLVHAGWRTDPDTAAEVVLATSSVRTPEPLREARRLAKEFREQETRDRTVGDRS